MTSGMSPECMGLNLPECDKLKGGDQPYLPPSGFVQRVGWPTIYTFRYKSKGTIFK